eukprot:432006_1
MPKYNIGINPSSLSKTERRRLTKAAKKAAQAKARVEAKAARKLTKEERRAKFTPGYTYQKKNELPIGTRCLYCQGKKHIAKDCKKRPRELVGGFSDPQGAEDGKGGGCGGSAAVDTLCYNCGKGDHRLADCPKKKKGTMLPFATCYICNEKGHISSNCESNTKGVYPRGGSCKVCGSIWHLAKDCTSTAKESATSTDEREQQNSIFTAPSLTGKDVDIPEGGEGDSVPSQRLTVKQLIQQKKMRKMQRVVRF